MKWNREPDTVFFQMIDDAGGWPPKAKSIVSKHGLAPFDCYFSEKEDIRDEWNTSIFTSDEYYTWKLSESGKNQLRKEGYDMAKRRLGVFHP